MEVDDICNSQIISPPNDFEFLDPRHDHLDTSDPAFDIDDVYMEPTDMDMDMNRDIVPKGVLDGTNDCLVSHSSQYGGQIVPLAKSSLAQVSTDLIPIRISNAIISHHGDDE